MTTTLKDLIEQHGANGYVLIDVGNGSAGPMWLDYDPEDDRLGTVMVPVASCSPAYEDQDVADTVLQVIRKVVHDYSLGQVYASDWIIEDNNPNSSNPYRYRILF